MDKESIYTREEINEICEEVERQWEYQLLARAAFPINPEKLSEYQSGDFYKEQGVKMNVSFPSPLTPVMQCALEGIHQWLNQNYIIRLYGILDQYKVIQAGKESTEPISKPINILYQLRQKVGAHSSGYRNPRSNDARRLTRIIQENIDLSIGDEQARHFNLAIDTVLFEIKQGCVEFVQSLEGHCKPVNKSTLKKNCSLTLI
jgi:hypothetical protein